MWSWDCYNIRFGGERHQIPKGVVRFMVGKTEARRVLKLSQTLNTHIKGLKAKGYEKRNSFLKAVQ